ncbi:hypothetical protein EVAR_89646_1 [Eumeta japonica]|uniref:Uncharacterized protein n=1 Tax=Eumeta variegata TaxID=151549 RepID=A0A4C1Z9Z2_EUMVA|nr:hypothetical protein EVAR_89646_1 [Eumeta japonica]
MGKKLERGGLEYVRVKCAATSKTRDCGRLGILLFGGDRFIINSWSEKYERNIAQTHEIAETLDNLPELLEALSPIETPCCANESRSSIITPNRRVFTAPPSRSQFTTFHPITPATLPNQVQVGPSEIVPRFGYCVVPLRIRAGGGESGRHRVGTRRVHCSGDDLRLTRYGAP